MRGSNSPLFIKECMSNQRFHFGLILENESYLAAVKTDGTVQRIVGMTASDVLTMPSNMAFTGTLDLSGATIATLGVTTLNATTVNATTLAATGAISTSTGDITATAGNILVGTAGKGLSVKSGSNAKIGTATLSNGTVTVSNTSVTANSKIFLSRGAVNASTTLGELRVSAQTASTSFVITSSIIGTPGSTETGDLSDVVWLIVEAP